MLFLGIRCRPILNPPGRQVPGMVVIVLIPLLPCAICRILCGILQLSQLVICIFPVFRSVSWTILFRSSYAYRYPDSICNILFLFQPHYLQLSAPPLFWQESTSFSGKFSRFLPTVRNGVFDSGARATCRIKPYSEYAVEDIHLLKKAFLLCAFASSNFF